MSHSTALTVLLRGRLLYGCCVLCRASAATARTVAAAAVVVAVGRVRRVQLSLCSEGGLDGGGVLLGGERGIAPSVMGRREHRIAGRGGVAEQD